MFKPLYYPFRRLYIPAICIALLSIVPSRAPAYTGKDAALATIQNLSSLYQRNKLSQRQYLDTIHGTMQLIQSGDLIFSHEELIKSLETYRKVIWGNKKNEKYKQAYYAILSNHAGKAGRNGEMLYYAERLSELDQQNNSAASISSLTILAGYYNGNLAYSRTLSLYKKHRQFIRRVPLMALDHQLERRELMRSGDMLSHFGDAVYDAKDSALGDEIEQLIRQLMNNVREAYPADTEMLARMKYSLLMALYEKSLSSNNRDEIWKCIQDLDVLFNDPHTPAYLKRYIGFTVADKKAFFFLETGENDSASYYIRELNESYNDKLISTNAYMVKKYEARLLYNMGHFKESEDTLISALLMLEATSSKAMSEVDEMMYALTKVEEQQLLLAELTKKQSQSDRRLTMLGFGAFVLLSSGVLVFLIVKHKQKARFLDFKLSLARNIHDEANPALLYAKILAKKQRAAHSGEDKGELEVHIEHIMELIRSLSHDLKADQQLMLGGLLRDIRDILEKISTLSEFSYSMQENIDKRRFLSHYQHANLRAILQECITNSIKHADFNHIDIVFRMEVNMLTIVYCDNGLGWADDQKTYGHGLQNMKDRMKKLNGDILIENSFPNGFRIEMRIKLR